MRLIFPILPRRKPAALLASMFLSLQLARAVTFQIYDPVEFAKIIDTNAVLTTNASGLNTWLEGPVWVPSGGYLLFCDQGNNKLRKLVPPTTVTDFIDPAANTLFNGTMLDAQERLIACEAGSAGLRVVMVTNGVVTTLCSTCNGLKFYSPNDVVVKSDGTIWFTDPGYNGITAPPPQPGFQPGYYVYQFNPTNGNATCTPVITNGLIRPNGLCFSPDESKLYVADSDASRHNIRVLFCLLQQHSFRRRWSSPPSPTARPMAFVAMCRAMSGRPAATAHTYLRPTATSSEKLVSRMLW